MFISTKTATVKLPVCRREGKPLRRREFPSQRSPFCIWMWKRLGQVRPPKGSRAPSLKTKLPCFRAPLLLFQGFMGTISQTSRKAPWECFGLQGSSDPSLGASQVYCSYDSIPFHKNNLANFLYLSSYYSFSNDFIFLILYFFPQSHQRN